MSRHPECKHPGPHDELCSCALLEMRDLRAENGRLRKWFGYLVKFIRSDQCTDEHMRGPATADVPCHCCHDYLQTAEHAAHEGGLPAAPSGGVE